MLYAHTKDGAATEEWQALDDHLQAVARLAESHAARFRAGEWGRLFGLLHDIGKCNPDFQRRLTGENRGHADHKGTGARLLDGLGTGFGRIGSYCVAGHHGGLSDFSGAKNGKSLRRIIEDAFVLPGDRQNPLAEAGDPGLPFAPDDYFQLSFFTRMLFSALVDADFLDTERFMDPEKSGWREPGPPLEVLAEGLDAHLAGLQKPGRINDLRAEILASCRERAALAPGLFTLTVPTGGGKTLSSMAFALDHAHRHGLRRVVYVIPYTSIIEQNARVFRDILPEGAVIEHHSTFDPRKAFGEEDNAGESAFARSHRLACENWDAPVVVTTNVQFFESLFAAKPSRCRKLHNLAGSVIVLDEAQMLPVEFLDPCLRALEELTVNYGCSVVLCTATQPALRREDFSAGRKGGVHGLPGLDAGRELAPDPGRLHGAFKRTELRDLDELALEEVAELVKAREQVLCIVNTRARAAELFGMVRNEPGARHLSALMCPAHRSKRLTEIRGMLERGEPCRVISTQLVEAGVDISFPEVIRELAGLDSIIQAAGRCNREGEREGLAPVSVFRPAEGLGRGFAAQAGHAESVLRNLEEGGDPFSPKAIRHYFRLHYWLQDSLDRKDVLRDLNSSGLEWYFREAARKFKLIDNPMLPVIVPWDGRAAELVEGLRFAEYPGGLLRELQQYTVQVYENQSHALDNAGAIEWVADTYAVLCRPELYDDRLGLTMPGEWRVEDFQV